MSFRRDVTWISHCPCSPPLPLSDVEGKSPFFSSDIKIALLSNVTTSFNVVSISLVLKVMDNSELWGSEETEEAKAACSSALIAGMVCGQLIFGR